MFLLIWHIWDKMSGHWTYLTPIGLVIISGITALFLVKLGIEHQNKQQRSKQESNSNKAAKKNN